MGIFDQAKDAVSGEQAQEFINQHDDQIDAGIDRAGDMVDEKTGGKFSDHIEKGEGLLQDRTGDNNA